MLHRIQDRISYLEQYISKTKTNLKQEYDDYDRLELRTELNMMLGELHFLKGLLDETSNPRS